MLLRDRVGPRHRGQGEAVCARASKGACGGGPSARDEEDRLRGRIECPSEAATAVWGWRCGVPSGDAGRSLVGSALVVLQGRGALTLGELGELRGRRCIRLFGCIRPRVLRHEWGELLDLFERLYEIGVCLLALLGAPGVLHWL